MRNKENMECYKWHKNDRICWVCEHEEQCKYEYNLYHFIDRYRCQYQESYYGHSSFPRCTKNEEGYVRPEDKEYCVGIKECKAKEIENFKRKYKLDKLGE